MNLIKCNLRGRKHELRDQVCEDSVYWSQNDSVLTVAVADGAGSSQYPFAKQGSAAVSKAICDFFNAKFDEFYDAVDELELMKVVETICKKALGDVAEENKKESIDEFASTLLCVSIKDGKAIACHIGDGVLGRCIGGKAELITMPENGEYAGSTYFMTMPDAYKYIQVRKFYLGETSHIFLMTDGVGENIYNPINGEFYNGIYGILDVANDKDGDARLAQIIGEKIVASDDASDDCTVAIISLKDKTESKAIPQIPAAPMVGSRPPVQPAPQPVMNSAPSAIPQPNQKAINELKDENKKLRLITIILTAVSVLLAVALAVVCFISFGKKDDDSDGDAKSNRVEASAEISDDADYDVSSYTSDNTTTRKGTTTEETSSDDSGEEIEDDNNVEHNIFGNDLTDNK